MIFAQGRDERRPVSGLELLEATLGNRLCWNSTGQVQAEERMGEISWLILVS